MTRRIIVAATLLPIIVVVVAVALYFAMNWGDSETSGSLEGHIIIWSDRNGDGDIDEKYVMTLDESKVTLSPHDEELSKSDRGERITEVSMYPSGNTLAYNEILNRSPDGLRVFASDRDGDFEIYVMTPDISGVTLLTHKEASNEYIYLTSGGVRTLKSDGVFQRYFGPKYGNDYGDIGSLTQLTHNDADDHLASWAPDGRIWFISDRDGDTEIYLMNSDGSGVAQLTHNEVSDGIPNWSPDGQRIAFTSDRDGDTEIYLMNSDGSGVTQLTHNEAVDGYAFWSPDGQHIAFASDRDGDFEIYVMNSDGSDVRQMTHNETEDFVTNWLPDQDATSPG